MAQQTTNVANLYADLNRHGQNGEYERALKVANRILHLNGQEEKAFHCKAVCLVHQGRFDEALVFINKNHNLAGCVSFEKGYCEYRLNRTDDALKSLRAILDPDDRVKELLGQVLYRLEEYEECFEVYRDLVKNTQDDYEEERETNLSAVLAALQGSTEEEVENIGLGEHTYELCYNAACYLIAQGRYKQAADKLKKAEVLCREVFEDDAEATEEDIDAELGVIRVQQGYVLQKLGRTEEAMKLYNQVLKGRPSDIALAAVASNNIVTLNKEGNVFDSKKKIKTATADGLKQKLTSSQKHSIALNQCLLYMYTNQGEQCRRTAQNLQDKYPDDSTPSLIEAAQFCKDKQWPKAIESLQKQIKRNPSNSMGLKLTSAQLHLTQGHVYKACDILRSLGDLSYKPGVVSALVTLYLNQEDKEAASDVLNDAVKWFKKNEPGSGELVVLMRENANFQLRHGDPQVATKMLEELRKKYPNDMKTLAQLIAAYSRFDPKKAQEVSRELPSPEVLGHDVDIEALEASVSTLGPKYIKKIKGEASPKAHTPKKTEEVLQKKKKKKRKGKLPKDYDAKADADPERWLPRYERSYYRGRRKDKRKDNIGKGTQGAALTSSDLDASIKAQSPSASASGSEVGSPRPGAPPSSGGTAPPTATAPSGPGPRQQKPGKPKKKKVPTATLR